MKRDQRLGAALGEGEKAARATVDLLRRYVLQETVTPLRHLVKRAAFGTAAAVLTAVGTVTLLVAVLRVLQGETGTALSGTWSFAPYLLTAVVAVALAGVAVLLAVRATSKRERVRRG